MQDDRADAVRGALVGAGVLVLVCAVVVGAVLTLETVLRSGLADL